MSASVLALALLLAAPTAALAAAPKVGLTLQAPVGLDDKEARRAAEALTVELSALGLAVVPGPAVGAACSTDSVCVELARASWPEDAVALVVVDLLRVGPVLQVSVAASAGLATEQQLVVSETLDEGRLKDGGLLPESVRAWFLSLGLGLGSHGDGGAAGAAPGSQSTASPSVTSASTTSSASSAESAPTAAALALPVPVGALVAGGVGALALAAGTALIVTTDPVLTDPKSTRQEKQDATALGWGGVACAAAGAAGIAVAVGLTLVAE